MPDSIRFSLRRHRDVGHLDGFQCDGGSPEHAFPLSDPIGAPRVGEGATSLGLCPLDELLGDLVVLEHHAAI
jgi:hypothetical protein